MVVARLNEHVAVVTGGASGIGRATVLGLVDEGAESPSSTAYAVKTSEVVNELHNQAERRARYVADLADASTLAPMVDDIIRAVRRIDIFVNSGKRDRSTPQPRSSSPTSSTRWSPRSTSERRSC